MTWKDAKTSRYTNYLICVFIAIAIVGCASGRTQSESKLQVANIKPIKSILIYEKLESHYFNSQLRKGISDSLINSLAACGVTVSYLPHDPLELNMQKLIIREYLNLTRARF